MFQKHLSIALLVIYSLFCLACLSWSADTVVHTLKYTSYYLISPLSKPLLTQMDRWGTFGENMARLIRLDKNYRVLEKKWLKYRFNQKKLKAIEEENQNLTSLLNIQKFPVYKPLMARVWVRDAHDFFNSMLIKRGKKDGIKISDPVITLQNDQLVLVGQISEVYKETSRVLFVTDSLSAVSARIERTGEQGAVEGGRPNRLTLNYLFADSQIKIGDEVVTAGLGGVFPPGIALGQVTHIMNATRRNFKRAYLKPALRLNKLREVVVLKKEKMEQ